MDRWKVHFSALRYNWKFMVTSPDFSVPHTQLWCLWKEDPLAFTIHHPELIMLKNIKSYRH